MKSKVKEWIKRYLPAEILSVIATMAAAWLTFESTNSHVTTALAGTWAGNIAYFGYILINDIYFTSRQRRAENLSAYSFSALLINLRALFVEFGFAEVLDSFFIRPALMYYIPLVTGNLSLGIFIAKIAADVTFYIPAIISYELSKKINLRKIK